MRFISIVLFFAALVVGKNILLTNDDGFYSTNIRATYYKLKEAGHDVYLVAPVSQRSGWGGRFVFPTSPTLETDGELGYVKAGEPSWNHESFDDHIWYFNGTPAACVSFFLQYVNPKFFGNLTLDLVVAGPNEGTNMSPGLYTLSGTMGATYSAVYRGIPAVAFSGSNTNNSLYTDSLDLEDSLSPSTIYAEKTTQFVNQLLEAAGDNRALPVGVGINVNYPKVGYESKDEKCVDPKWTLSRLTGEFASGPDMYYNETANAFLWQTTAWSPLSVCTNGDCSLQSENFIVEHSDCQTAYSVFNIDYDANAQLTSDVASLLAPLSS